MSVGSGIFLDAASIAFPSSLAASPKTRVSPTNREPTTYSDPATTYAGGNPNFSNCQAKSVLIITHAPGTVGKCLSRSRPAPITVSSWALDGVKLTHTSAAFCPCDAAISLLRLYRVTVDQIEQIIRRKS